MSGLLAKVPACIHDGSYTGTIVTAERERTVTRRCDACGTELHERTEFSDGRIFESWDPVYEALYTRRGRLRLLVEALEQAGWPVPRSWDPRSSEEP